KFDGTFDDVDKIATQATVALDGPKQSGRYPNDKSFLESAPAGADYSRARGAQLLSQWSELARSYMKAQGTKTKEVEMGYGLKKNQLLAYASTNESASAEKLQEALSDPRALLEWAMKSDNRHDKATATKLAFFEEQQKDRRGRKNAD